MQREDAVELLKQVSQIFNQKQVEQVAELLEYQPLALAAAAFYVQIVVSGGSPDYSWTEYLDALRKGKRKVTEKPLADQNVAYSHSMTAAVTMAIERAMKTSEVIRETFFFLSLCASEPITVEAAVSFAKARLESHMTDELIRSTILQSSLIVSKEVEDGAPKYLRLHNIVHDVLKTLPLFASDSTKKLQCIAKAINVFEYQLQIYLSTAEYGHRDLRRFNSHSTVLRRIALSSSDATAGLLKNLTPFITVDQVVSWLMLTAKACLTVSDISQAKELSKLTCDLLDQYISVGDLLRSDVFAMRGSVLSEVCDFNAAISYQQKALGIKIKLYGEEHRDVAGIYNSLGTVCSDMRRHEQANEFHEKALNIRTKLFRKEGGDFAASFANLANMAASYDNLGNVCSDLKRHNEAKKFYDEALNIRQGLFGEEHGDVVISYNNLGVLCSEVFLQHDQAKDFFDKARNISIKLYGEENGRVAKYYDNLGAVYSSLGQDDKAEEFHEKALYIRIKLYGEEHLDVANSYHNLGCVYTNTRKYNQAQSFFRKECNIKTKIYGENHEEVATSYDNLGGVYSKDGQLEEALECLKVVSDIRTKL